MKSYGRARLTGASEMERVLRRLPSQISEKVIVSATRSGATVLRKEMIERLPYGLSSRKNLIIARRDKKTGHSATFRVGPSRPAFFLMFAEFGSRHQMARPWLRPAFDAAKEKIVDKMGKQLGRAIERAAARLAGNFAKSGLRARRRRRR